MRLGKHKQHWMDSLNDHMVESKPTVLIQHVDDGLGILAEECSMYSLVEAAT